MKRFVISIGQTTGDYYRLFSFAEDSELNNKNENNNITLNKNSGTSRSFQIKGNYMLSSNLLSAVK